MLLISNYIFIFLIYPAVLSQYYATSYLTDTTEHFVSRETKKPLTAILHANLLSAKGWLSVLSKCKDQLSFKCQSIVTLTKSFWQTVLQNYTVRFPNIAGFSGFPGRSINPN